MHSSTFTDSCQDDQAVIALFHEKNPWGISISVDLKNCNQAKITSKDVLQDFVDALCKEIEMRKFGPCTIVHFGDDPCIAGFSMTQLIETSLISGHFANASNAAYIDIFSCKLYLPYKTAEFVQKFFGAEEKRVTVTFRY